LPRGTNQVIAKAPVFWSGMLVVQVPAAATQVTQATPANGGAANLGNAGVGAPPAAGAQATKNGSNAKEGSASKEGSALKDGASPEAGSASKDGSAIKDTHATKSVEGSASNGSGLKP